MMKNSGIISREQVCMWEASCTGDDLDFINNPGSVVRLAQSATLHVEALEAVAGVGKCLLQQKACYISI